MKKIVKSMILTAVISFMLVSTVIAARPEFEFLLSPNGTNFTENRWYNTNNKTYAQQVWSYKVSTIYLREIVNGGIGFRLINTSSGLTSSVAWSASRGVYTGGWKNGGPTGTYRIQARLDDENNTSGECTGYWNADYISTWPS